MRTSLATSLVPQIGMRTLAPSKLKIAKSNFGKVKFVHHFDPMQNPGAWGHLYFKEKETIFLKLAAPIPPDPAVR